MKKQRFLPLVFFILSIFIFFKAFLFNGYLPIPSDTIIGLYHPFRDLYAKEYPNGIPFKNFLITDPVRQQYPWRELAITTVKKLQIPLWNPYSFAGAPLLANFQSASFYPLNILFLFLPFSLTWSMLVFAQPLLAGIFLYFYLVSLRLNKWASLLGAFVFSFSGFSIAWLEWNTVMHAALWLPFVLLSIDKIVSSNKQFIWSGGFILALVSAFFAGHLQTFFYLFLITLAYFLARWVQNGKDKKTISLFIILYSLFFLFTAIQWIPTLQFIGESARGIDQADWQKERWFIPWQHLIQFIAPDFFGNPTTLNYWGVWNYAEFIGYIGIFPLIMAIFALFFRRDRKTLFFGTLLFISLIFSLPTVFAKLPYIFNISLLSTAQPTRLLFLIDFSLAILAALGFDYFLKNKKGVIYPLIFIGTIFVSAWLFVVFGFENIKGITLQNIIITKRNLIFPTSIFIASSFFLLFLMRFSKYNKSITMMIYIIIVGIAVFDLQRFGLKFTPFTNKEYLFPQTKTISFLQKQPGHFRIMTTDDRILPPNFSIIYRLQSIDGYDPLYLLRYGELIAASERGKPDISPPFGFNRIITPHNYNSKIIDLLGVKYILSLSDLNSPKLTKVFQEGETRIYENKNVFPRVFFVDGYYPALSKQNAIEEMFRQDFKKLVILEDKSFTTGGKYINFKPTIPVDGKANINTYSENKVVIETQVNRDAWLVFTDSYYPTWKAMVDGKNTKIFRANYNFRAISVPGGKHTVEFYTTLL